MKYEGPFITIGSSHDPRPLNDLLSSAAKADAMVEEKSARAEVLGSDFRMETQLDENGRIPRAAISGPHESELASLVGRPHQTITVATDLGRPSVVRVLDLADALAAAAAAAKTQDLCERLASLRATLCGPSTEVSHELLVAVATTTVVLPDGRELGRWTTPSPVVVAFATAPTRLELDRQLMCTAQLATPCQAPAAKKSH